MNGRKIIKERLANCFLDHAGSNSETLTEVLEGKEVIPGSADFFLYRIKDLDAVIEAHRKNRFGLVNDSQTIDWYVLLCRNSRKGINNENKSW